MSARVAEIGAQNVLPLRAEPITARAFTAWRNARSGRPERNRRTSTREYFFLIGAYRIERAALASVANSCHERTVRSLWATYDGR